MDSKSKRALEAIKLVALREGISVDTVYQEITYAIKEGYDNPDPKVREIWRMVPCSDMTPTPEDVIMFALEYLSDRQLT